MLSWPMFHYTCAMRRRFVFPSAALLAAPLIPATANAAVTDPLAALKSLYATKSRTAAPQRNTTIATLYDWADRNLRRKLMANGVCTIPIRSRDVKCSLKFDPAFAGITADPPVPDILAAGTGNQRIVTASFNDEDVRFEVVYTFTRNGDRWELSEYEARPPQGKVWRLSEFIPPN